jgi:hypothetical protein
MNLSPSPKNKKQPQRKTSGYAANNAFFASR